MIIAYADPPYVGQARKHYGHAEVDHRELIERLVLEYPDGWALSCSSPSLRELLPLCPPDVRVAAWVKPFCAFKRNVRPAYAWEPLLFRGGRNRHHRPPSKGGKATTPKDFVSVGMTLQRGLVGAKPERFCFWLFDVLGMRAGDELVDLFPGTGAVGRAWQQWQQPRVAAMAAQRGLWEGVG